MESGLKGSTVLVTGASGGIGQEIVRAFSKEETRVAIHYLGNKESAQQLADMLPAGTVGVFKADLRREEDVEQLWRDVESQLGPIQTLVANAGIYNAQPVPLHEMSLSQWKNTLDSNLTSVFLCFRQFFRSIVTNRIETPSGIIIGSTAGIFGEADHCDYATSKGALISGFLNSAKNEIVQLARLGRINAICPTWTITAMAEEFMTDTEAVVKALQTVPLRKFVRPADVAALALFLASPKLAGHVSGQAIQLAGGMEGRVLFSGSDIDVKRA